MIIKKIDKNYYEVKIFEKINIHNIYIIKELIKKITKKIKRKNELRNELDMDIYQSDFLTIIVLKDYNNSINKTNNTIVKVSIHTDTIFLYEIDYLDKNIHHDNIYFYQKKYYLKIKEITKDNFLYLSEHSDLIYQNTEKIIENGLRIKI